MAVLTTALNTPFTPAAGPFTVQSNGGYSYLWRQNNGAAEFTPVEEPRFIGGVVIDNPVAGASYEIRSDQAVTVSADQ